MRTNPANTIFCQNKKARYDYEVIDTVEAGIVLTGTEIKSVIAHNVSLDGSYATINDGSVTIIGCHIDPYKDGTTFNPEPKRQRRLLMHKSEIKKFAEKAKVKGFTLIPLSIYLNNGKAKVELAICKGKQTHDKRQTIKARDAEREIKNES